LKLSFEGPNCRPLLIKDSIMADYHTVYKDVEGTTTEWEDLQVKAGNLAPREKPKKEVWAPADEARKGTTEWLDEKTEEELENAEDEVDDDRFLEEYRLVASV
jgi:hypothetical protein